MLKAITNPKAFLAAATKMTARRRAVRNPVKASNPPLLGLTTTTPVMEAAAGGAPERVVPQPLQNFEPSSIALPQLEQYAILSNPALSYFRKAHLSRNRLMEHASQLVQKRILIF